jgi:Holliday junction resolvase RusA-like endonuclease
MKALEFIYQESPQLKEMSFPAPKIIYTIIGTPAPYIRCYEGQKGWDMQKQHRLHAENSLLGQRDTRPLLKGMLHLDIDFYFEPKKVPGSTKRYLRNGLEGHPCGLKPQLFNLVNFIEVVGPDVLWTKDSSITSLRIRKIYDKKPRTEISIMELK